VVSHSPSKDRRSSERKDRSRQSIYHRTAVCRASAERGGAVFSPASPRLERTKFEIVLITNCSQTLASRSATL
jgi:hypothetical protein